MLIGVACRKNSETIIENHVNKLLDKVKREADYTKDNFQHVPKKAGNEVVK